MRCARVGVRSISTTSAVNSDKLFVHRDSDKNNLDVKFEFSEENLKRAKAIVGMYPDGMKMIFLAMSHDVSLITWYPSKPKMPQCSSVDREMDLNSIHQFSRSLQCRALTSSGSRPASGGMAADICYELRCGIPQYAADPSVRGGNILHNVQQRTDGKIPHTGLHDDTVHVAGRRRCSVLHREETWDQERPNNQGRALYPFGGRMLGCLRQRAHAAGKTGFVEPIQFDR